MPAQARLRALASAIAPRRGDPSVAAAQRAAAVSEAVESELRGGAEAAALTAAEVELAEQFYQLDTLGYLVIVRSRLAKPEAAPLAAPPEQTD